MISNLPTLDMLEQTHQFPCPYVFKAIGKAGDGFLAKVVAAVREELLIEADPPYSLREAVGGRHLSVTLQPLVQNPQQVIAIYQRLKDVGGLVMLL